MPYGLRLNVFICRTAGALILDLTYGYNIREEGSDPLVDLADKVSISSKICSICYTSQRCLLGAYRILYDHQPRCIPRRPLTLA
jgi:hypothetical protein